MSKHEEIVADKIAEILAKAGYEIVGGEVEQNMRGGYGFDLNINGRHFDVNVTESGR